MVSATTRTAAPMALRDLADSLDEAVCASWIAGSDEALCAGMALVSELRNRLDAIAGVIAMAADRGAVQRNDGSRNVTVWVGAHTNTAPAQVRADLRNATWLLDYADFRDACFDGVLSQRHVDALRKAETPKTRLAMLNDQAMLVEFAASLSFADFGRALQYWVNAADPDGTLPDEQIAKNHVKLRRQPDGAVEGTISLDPITGQVVHEGVERETQKILREDADAGRKRTLGAVRAEALARLVDRGSQRADGRVSKPLISIVLGQSLAEDLIAWRAGLDADITADYTDIDRRCEFLDGTPLHPKLAMAMLGIAEMRRVVLDAESRRLDVSANTRHFPEWVVTAGLVASRGRCTERGCDAPFHWLEADHIRPYSKGGPSSSNNERPFCRPANHAKTDTWHPSPRSATAADDDDPDDPDARSNPTKN